MAWTLPPAQQPLTLMRPNKIMRNTRRVGTERRFFSTSKTDDGGAVIPVIPVIPASSILAEGQVVSTYNGGAPSGDTRGLLSVRVMDDTEYTTGTITPDSTARTSRGECKHPSFLSLNVLLALTLEISKVVEAATCLAGR
jgi:hypothetical protein